MNHHQIEYRISIGGEERRTSRLHVEPAPPLSIDEILENKPAAQGRWVLWQGEPTLRADLPALIQQLAKHNHDIWIRSDGLAIGQSKVLQRLQHHGLQGVIIPLHCLRQDANDWLLQWPGATKHIVRTIRFLLQQKIPLIVEIVLTRPTTPHIEETISGLLKLGVQHFTVRTLWARGPAAADFIALSPRLGLLVEPLTQAIKMTKRKGAQLLLEGVPYCLSEALQPVIRSGQQVRWVGITPPRKEACEQQPELCDGIDQDYVERFGKAEIWKNPTAVQQEVRLYLEPTESSRSIRLRMARIASKKVQRLRIMGGFNHPDCYELLRDALRLSIPEVTLCGDLSPLSTLSKRQTMMLRNIHRLDAALYGPTAKTHDQKYDKSGNFKQQLQVLDMFSNAQKGLYGIVSDGPSAMHFCRVELPYNISFRYAQKGVSLVDLLPAAQVYPQLQVLLPPCLEGPECETRQSDLWSGSSAYEKAGHEQDRYGTFHLCSQYAKCRLASKCKGIPNGWDDRNLKAVN